MNAWGTSLYNAQHRWVHDRAERTRTLVRRSTLIVPVNVERYVQKAHTRGADAIMLDLEDAIPDSEKEAAREAVVEAIGVVGQGGADVLVRINKPFELAVRDLDAVVRPGLTGLFFPKTESGADVAVLDALLTERELAAGLVPGSLQIGVAIETPAGFFNAEEIVRSSERIVTGIFGSEDLTLELGIEPTAEGKERFLGNATMVLLAASAGIQPLGRLGNVADYTNLDAWRKTIREAYAFGFKGSTCIHPAQVDILNECFSPDPDLVRHAERVIEAFEAAERQGRASTSVDGHMVDIPTVKRARRLLTRAAAIAAKP